MLLLQGQISLPPPPKKNMTLCVIGLLGSKGIVVKCTAAIFFRTADSQSLIKVSKGLQLFVNAKNGNTKRFHTNCLQDVHVNLH